MCDQMPCAGKEVTTGGPTIAMALSGKREEAHGVLSELLESQATRYVSPYDVAMIYNALDQHDKAIEWLERAIAVRDPRITSLKVEPIWKTLRTDARYVVLRKRMNLE